MFRARSFFVGISQGRELAGFDDVWTRILRWATFAR